MSRPRAPAWFVRHEMRLAWRDFVHMMTAGRSKRMPLVVLGLVLFAAFIHFLAYLVLSPVAEAGIVPGKATLAYVTSGILLSWTMMLSQAIESVTRAFYTRGDLELILSSPVPARRIFTVRIGAIAFSTAILATLLAAPVINVLAVVDGVRWLAAYGLLCAMAAVSGALAVAATVALFRILGPRRTRLIAQIVAAVVGAAFIIGVQAVVILSADNLGRPSALRSEWLATVGPAADSFLWWPSRAAMGDAAALAVILAIGLAILALAMAVFSGRFGEHVIAASGVAMGPKRSRPRAGNFRPASTRRALRRKEWMLLRRDPWLMSQTLMQILYLLPPALLLWRSFEGEVGALVILVPIIVMATGQLAGGLAWLAVSGEDAPDLVASAPISGRAVTWAKIEAVFGAVALVTGPLVIAMALAAPRLALIAALGIAVSTASATMIQIWFRSQAKRSHFRRRQTSSRFATLAEAFSAILWAATAGILAAGSPWVAGVVAVLALLMLGFTRLFKPRQAAF